MIARRSASRGYLLAWLGALAGSLLSMAVWVPGSARPDLTDCRPALLCSLIRVVTAGTAVLAGPSLGLYVTLRWARREVAGLTAWLLVVVCVLLVPVNLVIGPRLEGNWGDDGWTTVLVLAVLTSPLIARRIALGLAEWLRKYL